MHFSAGICVQRTRNSAACLQPQAAKRLLHLSIGPSFGVGQPIVAISGIADWSSSKYVDTGQQLLCASKEIFFLLSVALICHDMESMQSKRSA